MSLDPTSMKPTGQISNLQGERESLWAVRQGPQTIELPIREEARVLAKIAVWIIFEHCKVSAYS